MKIANIVAQFDMISTLLKFINFLQAIKNKIYKPISFQRSFVWYIMSDFIKNYYINVFMEK